MQAQALAELQVDRDIGCRAAGEEGGHAAFAQAGQHQRIGIAADLQEHDQRVDHEGHEQHAAEQHHQQVGIAFQGLDAGLGEGRGDQAEDAQRGEADHHLDDQRDAVGQLGEQVAGGIAGVAEGDAEADGPGQDADEVGRDQGVDRVVHHAQQQGLEHLGDAARRRHLARMAGQHQARGEGEAGDHRHHRGAEGADQVQQQDRPDMGLLALPVVGDGCHHQDEHQYRRDGLQRGNEDLADEADLERGGREEAGEQQAGDQADDDLAHQAGTRQQMKQGTFRVCHADFYSYRCVEGRPRQLPCRTTLCRSAPAKGWFERAG